MAKSTHPLLLRLAPWLLPVGTVIVWQLASSVGWLSTRVLPSPEGVLKAFWTLSASGELWQHLPDAVGGGDNVSTGLALNIHHNGLFFVRPRAEPAVFCSLLYGCDIAQTNRCAVLVGDD